MMPPDLTKLLKYGRSLTQPAIGHLRCRLDLRISGTLRLKLGRTYQWKDRPSHRNYPALMQIISIGWRAASMSSPSFRIADLIKVEPKTAEELATARTMPSLFEC
jgi:hypothetical protein